MKNKIISVLFVLILLAGGVTSIIMPDRYYSETEKRTLKQFPAISLEAIKEGKYGEELEKYFADQFPGRNGWVTIKTVAERASGKTEIHGVYFSKDGYLIEAHKSLSAEQMASNIAALKQLDERLSNQKISMKIMLVPTACVVLGDKLPAFAPVANQQAVIEYAKGQGLDVVDVTDVLKRHSGEYIFYRTDHHWTSLGSYYAYAAWKESNGQKVESIEKWTKKELCSNFLGTTYAKVNVPFAASDVIEAYYKNEKHTVDYNQGKYLTDSIYETKYLSGSDQYAVFFNSNQSVTKVEGNGEGKLLIIKDSYANCFSQFVIDEYEETHLIDLRFFRGSVEEYIKDNGITEVLVLYNIPNFCTEKSISHCIY